jgi:DNA-binding YbaB/EbfC family protein
MFKGGIPGMGGMMKKAQEMQANMEKAQEEIKDLSVVGVASGNLVTVTIAGSHLVTNISIDESVMDDKDMLEDLVLTAINDSVRKLAEASAEKMKAATGGMQLPGGLNLPF